MRTAFPMVGSLGLSSVLMSAVDMSGGGSTLPSLSPAALSEYDFFVLVDASGSMGEASTRNRGQTRWQEARELTEDLARFAAEIDDDGIEVITFNRSFQTFKNVKPDGLNEIFSKVQPGGGTLLAAPLKEAFQHRKDNKKPAFVIVMTDGAPSDKSDVADAIVAETKTLSADADLTVLFIQVGNDPGASDFLNYLDDNLQSEGAKFDVVDTIPIPEAEKMDIGQMLYKAQND